MMSTQSAIESVGFKTLEFNNINDMGQACPYSTYIHLEVMNVRLLTRYGLDKEQKDAFHYCPKCEKDVAAERVEFTFDSDLNPPKLYCIKCFFKLIEEYANKDFFIKELNKFQLTTFGDK